MSNAFITSMRGGNLKVVYVGPNWVILDPDTGEIFLESVVEDYLLSVVTVFCAFDRTSSMIRNIHNEIGRT